MDEDKSEVNDDHNDNVSDNSEHSTNLDIFS